MRPGMPSTGLSDRTRQSPLGHIGCGDHPQQRKRVVVAPKRTGRAVPVIRLELRRVLTGPFCPSIVLKKEADGVIRVTVPSIAIRAKPSARTGARVPPFLECLVKAAPAGVSGAAREGDVADEHAATTRTRSWPSYATRDGSNRDRLTPSASRTGTPDGGAAPALHRAGTAAGALSATSIDPDAMPQ